MKKADVLKLSSIPVIGGSYPHAPNRFINREYMIISYESDADAIRAVVPEPLESEGNTVAFEVMKMPDIAGSGCLEGRATANIIL